MKKLVAIVISLIVLAAGITAAQTASTKTSSLRRGFDGYELGSTLDKIKSQLKADTLFRYRGEADVSFLPKKTETVIDCEGASYLKRGIFQFQDEKLATIILMMNPLKMDYFTMYEKLSRKYGEPKALDPSQTVWESEDVRLALEKPLTIKYIDLRTFSALKEKASAEKSIEDISRERFLELF